MPSDHRPGRLGGPDRPGRLGVRKTYKLFIGGGFVRSESGRTFLMDADNVALASRKDVRNAVVAARKAQPGWAGATAYLRGQVLYRVAEILEGRHEQFVALGIAPAEVDATVDRWVWYAGWADKIPQVYGGSNPVAGPYLNVCVPEPTGVVGIVSPPPGLLGLVSVIAPAIVTGNTVVVLTTAAQVAVTLAEVLATADLPAGTVNLLTGREAEIAPWLASHDDVNALDLTGVGDPALAADLERCAADNLKRVRRPAGEAVDLFADPGLEPMTALLETKTVWHPRGF
ncbi:MAG TPA: aldehyde dehydrogenase family protein [Actinoplanes sp.]|nr:aldehyde dehydrogenase family protein [Actinoplanes sp.]